MSPDEEERQARTALHGRSDAPADVPSVPNGQQAHTALHDRSNAPAGVPSVPNGRQQAHMALHGRSDAPAGVPGVPDGRQAHTALHDRSDAPAGVPSVPDGRQAHTALHDRSDAPAGVPSVPDERQAHAPPTDVLNEHHRRNPAPRLPTEATLHAAAQQQLGNGNGDSHGDDDDDDDDDDDEPSQTKRKRKTIPDPKTLRYYTGSWRTALITAKKRFHGYIVLHSSFPSRENQDDFSEASYILTQVIEEMKEEDTIFSNGKFLNYYWRLLMTLSSDFSQDRDMNIVVSSESWVAP